ncbi:MAG: peptidylprolyl isomerase [Anaerolineae bacterium]|nr:peptidylprolyl isomerase [Anaerolineae bacterium]
MTQANKGSMVKVEYAGKLEDGRVFSASSPEEPIQFRVGDGRVIPGFEQALMGMEPGETKTVTILAHQAYGAYDRDKVHTISRDKFPADVQVGQQYQFDQGQNGPEVVTVTKIAEDKVTVDGNHPLAGRDLTFDIKLLEVV